MTSQPGEQTITIHILPNILRTKGNQTTKFVQLIELNNRNNFPQKLCIKPGRQTSFKALFFFFLKKKEALSEVNANGLQLNFNMFRQL